MSAQDIYQDVKQAEYLRKPKICNDLKNLFSHVQRAMCGVSVINYNNYPIPLLLAAAATQEIKRACTG